MWIVLLALGLLQSAGTSADAPPVPFVDRGACPFECCTYRDWTARREVPAHASYDEHRPGASSPKAVFTIQPGERVTAGSGVVVTTRAGRMQVVKPTTITVYSHSFPLAQPEKIPLAPGDTIYVLHRLGEGHVVGWYRGRILESFDGSESGDAIVMRERPVTEWWARVRNARGQFGWVRAESTFDNQDACG